MTLHPASERQRQASDPTASTWLHANAGSGKTKVLIDRVARLLLSGVEPQHILCLTYTKAAAAEMQNRLFDRLGKWAMKPDAALRDELLALGEDVTPSTATLARARQLFARAIETPGGLRIQTIHSFCATVLRRFPLEAGVTPHFTELDDRSAKMLRDDIAEQLGGSPEMAALARAFTGDDFSKLLGHITAKRAEFGLPFDAAACKYTLGLGPKTTLLGVLETVFAADVADWLPDMIATMGGGSINDVKVARILQAVDLVHPTISDLALLEDALLYGEKAKAGPYTAKIGKLATKETQNKLGNRLPDLDDLMRRVEGARQHRLQLEAFEKTQALHDYAHIFLPLYAAHKAARGWLDFDDLIIGARGLLTDTSVAQWVLYRLDGGIDHILVDEAQDTSPVQWQVIERLAAEFTTGQGARDVARTIFVVGDKKQSIYSFQGADVAAFDKMRADFAQRLSDAGQGLVRLDLDYSFRSSPVILGLVDCTFDDAIRQDLGWEMPHLAYHIDMPGRVELWRAEMPADKTKDEDWTNPVDLLTDNHHAVRLASRLADFIADVVATGTQIPTKDAPRAVRFGDFLVLVKRRSDVFSEIICACKAKGLPIVGADRLRLGGELAVKDLAALLSFLCSDMDDLSLAAVLRSPLCGWSEAQLYDLAQPRAGYLWEALRDIKDAHPETHAMLTDLRDQADFLRPYDLIERVLTRHDGRRKLLARLGDEAQDGIDELLSQALAYERSDVPSLTGFLEWLVTDDIEVKRQAEGAGDKIRVMTVHGAKGLEAPIVILPDTANHAPLDNDTFMAMPDGPALWKTKKDDSPAAITQEVERRAARRKAESHRLLYVAMTRAQSWLVVAAAGKVDKEDCWYNLIASGMTHAGASVMDDGGMVLTGSTPWPPQTTVPAAKAEPGVLDVWARQPAPPTPVTPAQLSPSGLGGAKALPGEDGQDTQSALAQGTLLHVLLETLPLHPAADWPMIAQNAGASEALLGEAARIIQSPALAHLFGADTLAEVAITATLAGRVMLGSIDRLVVGADHVLAVDFKSNRMVPATPVDVPHGILTQMGAYAAALEHIYPGKRIDTAVLWTRTASLMGLPDDLVSAAFTTLMAAKTDR
jgi:ATP-dependent helicase/nuclease subunit A